MNKSVLILDFGSQLTQLIARRIRELNIYCEIHPYTKWEKLYKQFSCVILSGSPASVYDTEAPTVDIQAINETKPILGICYGAQLIAFQHGGSVENAGKREYGKAHLHAVFEDAIFHNIKNDQIWMSHGDSITKLPQVFQRIASTEDVENVVFKHTASLNAMYGIQFHPEVVHSVDGTLFLKNFLVDICGIKQDFTSQAYVEETVEKLKSEIQTDNVILGLSGGVDSSVAALLLHRAIGKNLYCIFIDNGLLRKNEFHEVLESYQHMGLNVIGVNAGEEFLQALKGENDPEKKRKIIGRVFIEVFEREAKKLPNIKWLAQGTIYPDVIESVSVTGSPSATIKSHHNVGGLPEKLHLRIVEPLRLLFKDEVRKVGSALGLPTNILHRHPFPGPGLAVRILGDITQEKVQLLQEADAVFVRHLKQSGAYNEVWQAGVILLPVKSVGVMGDGRTYENAVALRAVSSTDGMTAEWSKLSYELLGNVSNEIINTVKGINRVVYDISTKPPATIEWE